MIAVPRRSPRRALLPLALLLAVAIVSPSLCLLAPSREGTETALVSAQPTAPAATAPAAPPGTLPAMLALAPNRLNDDLPLADVAAYADIAAATRTHGLAWPVSRADPSLAAWEANLAALALPPALAARGLDPIWERTYGFTTLHLHQVLTVGQAPDTATILHGDFDVAALNDAWVRSGYQAVETEGVTVWSLFPGDTIDLSAPASRPALGSLNNVYLLDDRTLIAAPRLSLLKDVLRTVLGREGAPSLAEQPDVAALLTPTAVVESFITAMLVEGQFLQTGSLTAATPTPPLPRVELALVGLLPPHEGARLEEANGPPATPLGGDGSGPATPRMVTLLAFDDVEAATAAVSLVQRRLAGAVSPITGEAYTARVQPVRVRVITDTPAVLVELGLHRGEADWRRILDDRDLGPLMWSDDPSPD